MYATLSRGPAVIMTVVFFGSYGSAIRVIGTHGEVGSVRGSLASHQPCPVEGVWSLDSIAVFVDGQPQPPARQRQQVKLVTKQHFAWVGHDPGSMALPLQTTTDSLAVFRTRAFGGGTYHVTDSTYTERIEYFFLPEYIGQEITFSCRVAGNRWYHSREYPILRNGRERGRERVDEVWLRIE